MSGLEKEGVLRKVQLVYKERPPPEGGGGGSVNLSFHQLIP